MFKTVSQTQIKYPNSPLSRGPAGTVQGGQRLPWIQFEDASGNRTDNFAALTTRQWQVHRYGDAAPQIQAMCDERGLKLHTFSWNADARRAGLIRNAVYLIRPDGHVAIVDRKDNSSTIRAYFDLWKSKSIIQD